MFINEKIHNSYFYLQNAFWAESQFWSHVYRNYVWFFYRFMFFFRMIQLKLTRSNKIRKNFETKIFEIFENIDWKNVNLQKFEYFYFVFKQNYCQCHFSVHFQIYRFVTNYFEFQRKIFRNTNTNKSRSKIFSTIYRSKKNFRQIQKNWKKIKIHKKRVIRTILKIIHRKRMKKTTKNLQKI